MSSSVSTIEDAATPDAVVSEPAGPRLDKRRFEWGSSVLVLPAALLIAAGFLYATGYSFYLGLTNLELIGVNAVHYSFTGLANVREMLHDSEFWHSLWLTVLFVIGSGVIGATVLGMVLALLMRRALAPIRLFSAAVALIAFMLPPVTIAVAWYAASVPQGTIAKIIGRPNADPLFSAPLVFVSLANTWSLTGLAMLFFAAALRNIPEDVVEAATLEGAGPARRFRTITVPLLKPTIVTSMLLMTLLSIGNFTIIYLMTAGGPGTATTILPVYSYQEGFTLDHLGYGALLANVTVLLALICGIAYVRVASGRGRRGTGKAS